MKVRLGPDGIHLFDRRTGTNVLVDEVTLPRAAWSAAPRQVSIALTNACDLECPFCYAPKHPAGLALEEVCAWVEQLDAAGCLGVGFGGGEPTLYRRLPVLCHHINRHTDLAVTLTTHAHRWTPDLVDELDGAVHFVRVSVDGTGATYEDIRGRSYNELRDKLALIAATFSTGLNCVVNDATIGDLDTVADLAGSSGAVELLLLPQRAARGVPGVARSVAIRMERWVDDYVAAGGPLRITVAAGGSGELPIGEPLPLEVGLRSYAHIDATGTVRPTSYSQNGVKIGEGGVMPALAGLAQSPQPEEREN